MGIGDTYSSAVQSRGKGEGGLIFRIHLQDNVRGKERAGKDLRDNLQNNAQGSQSPSPSTSAPAADASTHSQRSRVDEADGMESALYR